MTGDAINLRELHDSVTLAISTLSGLVRDGQPHTPQTLKIVERADDQIERLKRHLNTSEIASKAPPLEHCPAGACDK